MELLDPSSRANASKKLGLIDRLGEKSSAPASIPLIRSSADQRRHHHHREILVAAFSRILRQTS